MARQEKNALVAVDFQNDFVMPPKDEAEKLYPGVDLVQGIHWGSLSVPGGVIAADTFADFINSGAVKFHEISFTHDCHDLHIATPIMWVDSDGNHPAPFTWIKSEDVINKKWRLNVPVQALQQKALDYIIHLETEGRYILTVWFPHCQIGSYGAALYKPIIDAAVAWRDKNIATLTHVTKGSNPWTEHYSGMKAAWVDPSDHTTGMNKGFIKMIQGYDNIYFGGLALNFCVRETMLDIIREFDPDNVKKIVLLTDCTSAIPDPPGQTLFQSFTDSFLDEATSAGMRLAKAADLM